MKQLPLLLILCTTTVVYAADPDPRLAGMRKAVVLAADDLSDDKIVASCVEERIGKATPIQIVSREDAELILTVSKANVGKHPKAEIAAALPNGTVLWTGGSKTRGFNFVGRNMTCVIANDLIDNLRKAMQKAREITEKANRASLR